MVCLGGGLGWWGTDWCGLPLTLWLVHRMLSIRPESQLIVFLDI